MAMSVRPALIVGLGNPGKEYEQTRHNIGFAVVEALAKAWHCSFKRKWRLDAEIAEVAAEDGKRVLAKPRTFMNRSGLAVAALLRWLKTEPANLLVVVDDVDLELGDLRLRPSGGSGGHNGLRSIIGALDGNEVFPRLRVGIGRRAPAGADLSDHVLGRFAADEREAAREAVARAVAAIECLRARGLNAAMNEFNRRQVPRQQN